MDFQVDMAIELIDQTASDDLERCQTAVRSGDEAAALTAIGQAISRLGAAKDALRDIPRQGHELGLHVI